MLCAAAVVTGGRAAAQEYQLDDESWSGLSELIAIAGEENVPVDAGGTIDIATLSPDDALLIVYPRDELPRASLSAFLRSGGRVAVADDYGESASFLAVYGIRHMTPPRREVPLLRGNPELLIATPHMHHPLVENVRSLVTNHPRAVHHAELDPVVSFTEDRGAGLVLTGAVEQGRLVVLGDPSVLINNMLRFRDNRRFAANLLRYLHGGNGRVVIATPGSVLKGEYGRVGANPVERLRGWLDDLAHAETPPIALHLMAVVLVAILAVFAVSSLPLRSPYDVQAIRPPGSFGGGFAGRVHFFGQRPRDLIHPLMVYKFELEGELVRRLGLSGQPLLRDVLDAARRQGLSDTDSQRLRALLLELDQLRRAMDLPPAIPRVGRDRFRQLVDEGEALLARVAKEQAA